MSLSSLTRDVNYTTLGKMKSEVGENIITEFCALNPKCYSYRYVVEEKIKENKKAKGISMAVVDQTMDFNHYQKVMESNKPEERFIYSLTSFNQQLFSCLEEKVALSSFYDKFVMLDAINCVPYGYHPKPT